MIRASPFGFGCFFPVLPSMLWIVVSFYHIIGTMTLGIASGTKLMQILMVCKEYQLRYEPVSYFCLLSCSNHMTFNFNYKVNKDLLIEIEIGYFLYCVTESELDYFCRLVLVLCRVHIVNKNTPTSSILIETFAPC